MIIGYNLDNTDKQKEADKTLSCIHHQKRAALSRGVFFSVFFPNVCVYLCVYMCVFQNLVPTVYRVLDPPLHIKECLKTPQNYCLILNDFNIYPFSWHVNFCSGIVKN